MADGTLKVGTITTSSGSGTITLGASGETVDMSNGTMTLNSSMKMTPAFEATLTGSAQTINDASYTKINCDTEVYDTDGCYDNSTNYRFTPTTAGKYYVYGKALIDNNAGNMRNVVNVIYKNGSSLTLGAVNFHSSDSNDGEGASAFIATVVDMNGSSDYLELYVYGDTVSGGTSSVDNNERRTAFGAYRLIGV